MLQNYSRDYYLEDRGYNQEESAIPAEALVRVGLDWNYFIASYLDRDLHERLLPFDANLLTPFIPVLVLIKSGYFDTAQALLSVADIPDELFEILGWLRSALLEADNL